MYINSIFYIRVRSSFQYQTLPIKYGSKQNMYTKDTYRKDRKVCYLETGTRCAYECTRHVIQVYNFITLNYYPLLFTL